MADGVIKNIGTPRDLFSDDQSVLFELASKLTNGERRNLLAIINGRHDDEDSDEKNTGQSKIQSKTLSESKHINRGVHELIKSYVNDTITLDDEEDDIENDGGEQI